MKFDVIIGNPPYQRDVNTENDTQHSIMKAAYSEFINKALDVRATLVSMIVPAKWYTDNQDALIRLRHNLKNEGHLQYLVDYKDSRECFESVRVVGGICYFLYNRNHIGNCTIKNITGSNSNTATRNITATDTIIRDNIGVSILNKVLAKSSDYMDFYVESSFFDIKDNSKGYEYKKSESDYEILSSENNSMKIKYIDCNDIQKNKRIADEDYKLVVGKLLAGGGDHPVDKDGFMKILSGIYCAEPKQVFVSTYLMVYHSTDKNKVINCEKYIKTRFVRFLLYLGIAGLNINRNSFRFVPLQTFEKELTDEELYSMYDLSDEETSFINSFIKGIV